MRVGAWRLVSFGALDESGVVPDDLMRPVARLVDAYRLPPGSGQPIGVVAVPNGGHVGAPFDRSAVRRLGHALLAGAVACNPPMAVPEDEEEPNAGWAVATSENALLYGHPFSGGNSYAIETGVLAKVTAVRHAPGDDPLPSIEPPTEVPRPMFASFDDEIADAVLAALCTGQAPARRLERALDWYRIALSNSEAVSLDVRVGAARSALEILTEAGDATRRLVRAYGELVRDDLTTRATYSDVFWARGPVQLTPDEWWMTRLCELRNAIVHGDRVPAELWEHEGHHQINEIHDRLISALRIVVADETGDPVLRLRKSERVFARMAEHVRLICARHRNRAATRLRRPTRPPRASLAPIDLQLMGPLAQRNRAAREFRITLRCWCYASRTRPYDTVSRGRPFRTRMTWPSPAT